MGPVLVSPGKAEQQHGTTSHLRHICHPIAHQGCLAESIIQPPTNLSKSTTLGWWLSPIKATSYIRGVSCFGFKSRNNKHPKRMELVAIIFASPMLQRSLPGRLHIRPLRRLRSNGFLVSFWSKRSELIAKNQSKKCEARILSGVSFAEFYGRNNKHPHWDVGRSCALWLWIKKGYYQTTKHMGKLEKGKNWQKLLS